ncbi:hypothetical protein FHW15_000441 [Terracoccus luteus]|jgi:hypothetical protein|uniref:DUF3072 family protein n=1 Tax=Terracoccus luteus TaxID=53356 RepID=A0A839PTF6_9MICO|nr:hypothetical protein [Terracoccus luteus]MCP2170957.1 hypothetical protein [Terracoccus luteus]
MSQSNTSSNDEYATGPSSTDADTAATGVTTSPDAGSDPTQETGQSNAEVLGAPTGSDTVKDPDDWVTGDEPMTGAQRSYLDTLARQAGETLPADLTKAQASEHIDRLQEQTGRGAS